MITLYQAGHHLSAVSKVSLGAAGADWTGQSADSFDEYLAVHTDDLASA